ncbi:G2/M phase-specific E3 ubiquitin-protein ligase-like [Photinus pyralis]|nr:G2/M phase-specific E3 ubiquitin-protein ligase-like [Photinus pyralis]XP_031344248.1 G2/M phase-specific E3 ubiquitin-protein ligase-like [Photinus pyralis]
MKLEDLNNLIYSLFSDKLMNSEYEFVVPISGRLTKLSLQSGSQLNGETLKRVYHQKVVYIRPMEDLADNNSNCTPEMNNVDTPTPIDDNDGVCLTDQWHSSPTGFDVQSDNLVNSGEETNLLQEILTNINSKISLEKTNQFNVYRADVFHCCIRAIRRSSFDPFAKIDVKFSDIDGQSEGAVDMGGPTRELFRLLMNYLKNSNLFMGPDKKYISLDALALDKRYYYDAGRMVALSIVHAGLGPHFFSNSLFVAVTKGVEFVKPLKEFVECDILEKINKLSHINDETEMREYLLNESVFSIAGINIVNQLIARKDEIIDATVKFYHIYRTKPALDQLIDGLKTCNVLEFLQNHPILFEDIVCDNKSKLNNTIIEELPTVMLSEVGSNKRQTQNRILAFWRDYLLDCEEENSNCSLEELLVFVTGADTVPALGFGTKIYIRFQHDDKMMYPKANTCGLELYLPTCHTNFDDFKYHMDFGIGNSKDFGIA